MVVVSADGNTEITEVHGDREIGGETHLQSNLRVSVPSPILRASTAGSVDWVIEIGD